MKYKLEDVDLSEISGVTAGANQHADVVLFKSLGYNPDVKPENTGLTEKGDGSVTVEELTKKLEDLQSQVTDLTEKANMAEDEKKKAEEMAANMKKAAEDAGFVVEGDTITKAADPEYVEIDGEKVEKSLVPAPVLKAIEKQAEAIAKMEKAAKEVELAKSGATELPNLAGTDLAKGKLLAAVAGDEELLKGLKAADAAMASQYVEKGTAETDEASPTHKLNELAKAHASAQNVSFETAYAEVTKAGPGADLLAELRTTAN
jgi:TolA-binding protein